MLRKDTPAEAPEPGRSEISVTDAVRAFSDVINRVRYRGERFVLTKGGQAVAEIRPVVRGGRVLARDLAERLATLPHLGAAEASRLAADIDEARGELGPVGAAPWE